MSQDKFQNKYRNGTFRAQWWDYGWNGAYFVTICTQGREHYFGEIKDGKMILSHTGVIAHLLWHEIPKHHTHIELGDFVVMPNHIHGIIIIDKPNNDRIVGQFGHFENDGGCFENGGGCFENDGGHYENGGGCFENGDGCFDNGGGCFENGDGCFDNGGGCFENGDGCFDNGGG
ncbi:MAG TPA: hypothetical protein PKN22_09220, partial [Taishania sp.]|nr:hypothetical protein [Taishania sp.]